MPPVKIDLKNPLFQWATLLFLAFIWGSSFILMKKGLLYYSNTQVAAYRVSIAWLVLLPIALRHLKKFRTHLLPLFISGLCGNALPAFLFTKAQTVISSSLSGMLNSLVPLFTLLIGIFFGTRPRPLDMLGILLALAGAAGLIGYGTLTELDADLFYPGLVVAATVCYAISVNVIKNKLADIRPVHITALAFMTVGPFCFIYLLFTGFIETTLHNPESWKGIVYISILGVVGTSLAVIVFNQLIKETTAVFASSVTYLIPIVAIFWGFADGEVILLRQLLMILLVLLGVYLINSKHPGALLNRFFR